MSLLLWLVSSAAASALLLPLNVNAHDSVYGRRIYMMGSCPFNNCRVFNTILPATLDNFPRVAGVTLYQASQTIIFEPGFLSEDGANFTAEILPNGFGVPQATNLTGTADANMNWIQSRNFDETGVLISDAKQFYDAGGRSLQTQSKVFYRETFNTVFTHVFASQSIQDAYGRDAATTLPAPIDYADFSYRPNFVQHNSGGNNYSHQNFDLYTNGSASTDKTDNPDVLWDASSGNPVQGTLAWYYSTSNYWEPYTPVSNYPYSRETYYNDGTGTVKKQGGTGDAFVMGSGKESSSYVTPVINELEYYIQIRNHFFAVSDLGTLPNSLSYQAIQIVSRDPNGREVVMVQDKSGKTLMTARQGTDLVQTANTVTLSALPYSLTVPATPSGSGCSFGSQLLNLYGNGQTFTLTNPANLVLTISGPSNGNTVNFTATDWGTVIRSDEPFNVVYSDKQGSGCTFVPSSISSQTSVNGALKEYYFKILADNTSVTLTGDYTLYNMSTWTTTALLTGNKLNQGYYKVLANTGNVTLTYANSFADVSYNFYNQQGVLIATIPPEGVKKLKTMGLTAYSTRTAIPYISLYNYDIQGRIASVQNPDKGVQQFFYRLDGRFRFSQNAIQAAAGSFSYINYDQLGRVIESGQYQPNGSGILFGSSAMTAIVESTNADGGLTTGIKTDVSTTKYDVPDNSHGLSGYLQDAFNLAGAVSFTQKYSSITNSTPSNANLLSATWFNYDEEGKAVWIIKYISGLGYKTTDYTYDVIGNLVKKSFQKNTASETFVHYYDFDPANKQLWHIYTSTVDNNDPNSKKLQATYFYYLHGGIKRVELAGTLQGIDYTYTLQGALKAINNSDKTQDPGNDGSATGFGADAYGEVLDYYTGDYTNGRTGAASIRGVNTTSITSDSYVGNVKAMTWYSEKPASTGLGDAPTTYVYQYDPKYQFTESTWGNTLNFSTNPASFVATGINKEKVGNSSGTISPYDGNGNIQYLQRTNASGTLTDQFTYHYDNNNNQLTSVVNAATSQTYANYTYDFNGQVTNEGTASGTQTYLVYDVARKVTAVYRDAAHTQLVAGFVYDEFGQRIQKSSYTTSGQLYLVTYYAGDVLYQQTVTGGTTFGPITAQEYQISESGGRLGIYYRQNNIYAYELSDHLGNVRAVIAQNGGTYEVRMYTDYYPYGMVISNGGTNDYRFGYQGQNAESDPETGWNAFELRMYNGRIGRWLQYDPEGEFSSPYLGAANNPVTKTDPDGGCTGCPVTASPGDVYKENGVIYVASIIGGASVWSEYLPSVTVSFSQHNYFENIFIDRFQNNLPLSQEQDAQYYKDHVDAWNKWYTTRHEEWKAEGEVFKFILTSMIPVPGLKFIGAAARYGGLKVISWAGERVVFKAVANPLYTTAAQLARHEAGTVGSAMFGTGVDNAFRAIVDAKQGIAAKVLNFAERKGYIVINPGNKGADIVGMKLLSGSWWDVTTVKSWGSHVAKYGDGGVGLFYLRPF